MTHILGRKDFSVGGGGGSLHSADSIADCGNICMIR